MTIIIKSGSALETYEKVKKCLLEGKIIGLPTETVYGLAGDATNNHAIAQIFALKNRPSFNPLICHFSDLQHVLEHCTSHPSLATLAQHFWPGPLTIILKRKPESPIKTLVTAGLETIAVRIPDHPIALEVIERLGTPLAAPSANISESISPTTAEHVLKNFPNSPFLPIILDGGPCRIGVESTILNLANDEPIVLRPGAVSAEDLKRTIANLSDTTVDVNSRIRAPGMLKRHYAPSIPLRLNATDAEQSEAMLAFGPQPSTNAKKVLSLSPSANLNEAAANLFKMLYELDDPSYSAIAVMPIPLEGIGVAINDRLQRAAFIDNK